jgi:hypothetical protein
LRLRRLRLQLPQVGNVSRQKIRQFFFHLIRVLEKLQGRRRVGFLSAREWSDGVDAFLERGMRGEERFLCIQKLLVEFLAILGIELLVAVAAKGGLHVDEGFAFA